MSIEQLEKNIRAAAEKLAEIRQKLPDIKMAERNHLGNIMLQGENGEYRGYVDCFRGAVRGYPFTEVEE